MSGYVDIHCHLLPYIDDGAPDLAEALAMARAAVDSGIKTIAATPHLHPSFPGVIASQLADRCRELRVALADEDIALEVVEGAEASIPWVVDARAEELVLASYGQRGRDLLLETPFGDASWVSRVTSRLGTMGYRITLAHPERSPHFQHDVQPLLDLVDQGVLLQVNAESLLSRPRRSPAGRLAQKLVSEGRAHVLASDAHRAASWRPVTRLAAAVSAAAELVGPERARWMAAAVPRAIIEGSELPPAPPITKQRQRRRWAFGAR